MFAIPMNTRGTVGSLTDLMQSTAQSVPSAAPTSIPPVGQPVHPAQPAAQSVQAFSQTSPTAPAQPMTSAQSVQLSQQPRQGVHLKKGQRVNLATSNIPLRSIRVGLGWDVLNQACDLDASAFLLGQNGRVLGDDWFVFYGQPISPDGSVQHSGDSAGEGSGDDETITINLQTINPNCKSIVFVVTIDEALTRGLNFSMVANAYVRVVNQDTNQELIRFTLSDYYANVTSMIVGEVYNNNGIWKFKSVGDGVAKDLAGLCAMYGVNVAD